MDPVKNMVDRLREAAILVTALDDESAERLLATMHPELAERVRDVARGLDSVSPEERTRVIRTFLLAQGRAVAAAAETPDATLARRLAQARQATGSLSQNSQPFAFLAEASNETLLRRLDGQHPQVVAAVVAHLPPARAAELLTRFTPQRQAEVLQHVTQLQDAEPALVESLERDLRAELEEEILADRRRSQGLAIVTSILNAAGGNRRELLASLARHGGDMFAAVESQLHPANGTSLTANGTVQSVEHESAIHPVPRQRGGERFGGATHDESDFEADGSPPGSAPDFDFDLDFEELRFCDDRGLALLLHEANPRVALLALAGASPRLMDRIARHLPAREARSLRRKMEQLGPLRLDDIRRAQDEIARLARQLIAAGCLHLPPNDRFAAAA